jgi:small subunit ribosomal protein S17
MADEETRDDQTDEPEPAAAPAAGPAGAASTEAAGAEPDAGPTDAAGDAAATALDDAAGPAAEPVAAEDAGAAADEPAERPAAGPPAAGAEQPSAPEPPARTKRKRLPRALRHKHARPARAATDGRSPIVRAPKPESTPGRRQERRGVVVSDKGDKSIVVEVATIRAHAKYKKVVRRSRRLHAHDEQNDAAIGDVVRIVETRPLSKLKRWRLAEIVEKAK